MAVYAIALNEEHQLERWASTAAAADLIVIADTGSTDGTVGRARKLGIETHQISVEPFRFDCARNRALELVPEDVDVCLSLDLDEELAPDWRPHLESAWRDGATKVGCRYEWRWSDIHAPLRWSVERIHARHGYRWEHPVHEQLVALGDELIAPSPIELRHLRAASAARPSYLELLRLAVSERPDDGRMAHMLANELRMLGLSDEAREWFLRALELSPPANERLHSMLMLSHLDANRREDWLVRACGEFAGRREPWCELAQLHLDQRRWHAALRAAQRTLAITDPADDYLANPYAWGPWPERMAARAAAELGKRELAAHHERRARRLGQRNCAM